MFKVSDQNIYADKPGEAYCYDNTNSVRVARSDEFLNLAETRTNHGLTGASKVSRVTCRGAEPDKKHNSGVNRVFTACIAKLVWFANLFDLSLQTKLGMLNRRQTELPRDLNRFS